MCGIFGVTDNKDSSFLTYIALYSLQHRGQESCGIVSWGRKGFKYYNGMGLVQEVFNRDLISNLSGDFAIGHVRYSTTGSSTISNAQPLFLNTRFGEVAVAHNGNIINSNELKRELSRTGSIFQTTTDSEIIVHLISRSNKKNFIEALSEGLSKLKGAFSFVFLVENKIIAARDPWGFRPLVIGRKGKSFAFASETTALDSTGYDFIGEVEPGEIAVASNGKIKKTKYSKPDKFHRCIFEQVYFARPDSIVLDKTVAMTRYEIGKLLAAEFGKSDADIVSGVPDSGTSYALGFSKESGINYMPVFMKNHYAPRSFLQPQQSLREFIADLKLAPIKDFIKGKKIILIDDSLVRGTTSRKIVGKLKKAGAKKVYLLIASPPIRGSCFYGIDTPTKKELIANRMNLEEIRDFIGADKLYYISLKSLVKACGNGDKNFCTACFDRNYPIL